MFLCHNFPQSVQFNIQYTFFFFQIHNFFLWSRCTFDCVVKNYNSTCALSTTPWWKGNGMQLLICSSAKTSFSFKFSSGDSIKFLEPLSVSALFMSCLWKRKKNNFFIKRKMFRQKFLKHSISWVVFS